MVAKCCCGCSGCCTIETGSTHIAMLSIIAGIIQITRNTAKVILMLSSPEKVSEDEYPGFRNHSTGYIQLFAFGIFLALVYTAFSGLLLRGVITKNVRLCKPWLYWNYISIALLTTFVIVLFFILDFNEFSVLVLSLAIVLAIIIIGIVAYFVNVVQRFVDELKKGANAYVNRNIN